MKTIRRARIIIVAGSGDGLLLAGRLWWMDAAQVTAVPRLDEATRICRSGGADLCVVVANDVVSGQINDATGRESGIPSVLVADVATPRLRSASRRSGYRALVAGSLPSRMLYRALSGTLQRWPAKRHRMRPAAPLIRTVIAGRTAPLWPQFSKPTLH